MGHAKLLDDTLCAVPASNFRVTVVGSLHRLQKEKVRSNARSTNVGGHSPAGVAQPASKRQASAWTADPSPRYFETSIREAGRRCNVGRIDLAVQRWTHLNRELCEDKEFYEDLLDV